MRFMFKRGNVDFYLGTDSRGNDITNDNRVEYDNNNYKQNESDRIMSEKDINKNKSIKEPYDSQGNHYNNNIGNN